MAATDASPFPQKGIAFRVTFPIVDGNGDLVSGASGLDSEVDKDAAGFADCTNEATEIATSSGIYYLDLTSSEMDADTVSVIVKSTEGKTVPIVLNPDQAILTGTVDNTAFAPTTTQFESDDITEATADHYKGRVIVFITGNVVGQACVIEAYELSTGRGKFTVSVLTEAPANNERFRIY
jgi:hypothetical protein